MSSLGDGAFATVRLLGVSSGIPGAKVFLARPHGEDKFVAVKKYDLEEAANLNETWNLIRVKRSVRTADGPHIQLSL